MAVDFNEICRLCMMKEPQLLPLFQQDGTLLDQIMVVVPELKLDAEDGLPTQVCGHCAQQINLIYNFKLQCETSDFTLRQLLAFHQLQGEACETVYVKQESDEEICFEDSSFQPGDDQDRTENEISNVSGIPLLNNAEFEIIIVNENADFQQDVNDGELQCHNGSVTPSRQDIQVSTDATNTASSTVKRRNFKYTCKECGKVFRYEKSFNRHVFLHTGIKPYKCGVCGKQFAFKNNLETHYKLHNTGESFACNECGKCFTFSADLKQHMKTHTVHDTKKLVCDICGNIYPKRHFKRHLLTHSNERPFECQICEKRFTNKTNLNKHLLFHTGEKPYSCDICGHSFSQSSNLANHKKTHLGLRPHECRFCGRKFVRGRHLKMHLLCHTGERSFSCTECERTFARKDGLQAHMKTHTNDKPFLCPICGDAFKRDAHLQNHLLTHSDTKPFVCDTCGKTFIRKIRLIDHLSSHTGVRRFSCPHCDKGFVRKEHLNYHLYTMHGQQQSD